MSNWEGMMMTLNPETKNTTLNIKLKTDDGSECQNWECDSERQTEKRWWLWTPELRSDNDVSECRNWKCYEDGSKHRNWEAVMTTLNPETEKCDFECQIENRWWLWMLKLRMRLWTSNWEVMMALNAETENATLNVKLRSNDGSERRNWEATMMALNAETENAMRMTLNTETEKWWLWTPKLRSGDDDSEPQNWKMWLWTSNWKSMMALNIETENVTLNIKLKVWLWKPNWKWL